MATILLVIQIFIVLALIGVILLQKTGSDSLAGLSGGGNNILSNKSTSNLITKITIFLALGFALNSLLIAKVTNSAYKIANKSIVESIEAEVIKDSHAKEDHPKAPKIVE